MSLNIFLICVRPRVVFEESRIVLHASNFVDVIVAEICDSNKFSMASMKAYKRSVGL